MKLQPTSDTIASRPPRRAARGVFAFTMIEIAISLAIIGFALVAIVGILPEGMKVQQQNREETVINEDANFLLNAICNGERGINDLTNYVVCITNYVTRVDALGRPVGGVQRYWYTRTNSSTGSQFPLSSGYRIIGLLSTPKLIALPSPSPQETSYLSNSVVAVFRCLSGPASEKFPQNNPSVQDFALTYRVYPSVIPYRAFDPWDGRTPSTANTNEYNAWLTYWETARNLQANLHDVRLTFRWPVLPGGKYGKGYQMYRTSVGGFLMATNEPAFPAPINGQNYEYTLHFFEPRTYVKAP